MKKGLNYNVGDIVKITNVNSCTNARKYNGVYVRITNFGCTSESPFYYYDILDAGMTKLESCYSCIGDASLGGIVYSNNKNNTTNMSIISKFKMLTKGEPEKSYIKSGIMDQDEVPTDDGMKIAMAYLLKDKEFSAKFKADVVDPLIKDIDDNK